jgi:hypothetical protein
MQYPNSTEHVRQLIHATSDHDPDRLAPYCLRKCSKRVYFHKFVITGYTVLEESLSGSSFHTARKGTAHIYTCNTSCSAHTAHGIDLARRTNEQPYIYNIYMISMLVISWASIESSSSSWWVQFKSNQTRSEQRFCTRSVVWPGRSGHLLNKELITTIIDLADESRAARGYY